MWTALATARERLRSKACDYSTPYMSVASIRICGMLCNPRAKIVIAQLWSRSITKPQFGQSCIRTRKSFSTFALHLEHIWLVWIDLHHSPTSIFSFVRCELNKLTPGRISNGFGGAMVFQHPSDVQLFKTIELDAVTGSLAVFVKKPTSLAEQYGR
jgi:hypothetical protein